MTIDVKKEPHKAARAILYALTVAEQKMFGNTLKGSLEERVHRIWPRGQMLILKPTAWRGL